MASHLLTLFVFWAAVVTLAYEDNRTTTTCKCSLRNMSLISDDISLGNSVESHGTSRNSLILENNKSLHLYPATYQHESYRAFVRYHINEIADLEIEPDSFANLRELRIMHIVNSNWATVKNHTFRNLPRLEALVIANDSVKEVQANAFRCLPKLDILEITNNQIVQLPVGVFSDLCKVTSLLLHHNGLESLEDGVLVGLRMLKTLDLSHNKITVLRTSDINKLKQLTHLYLSHNRIIDVDGGFKGAELGVIYFQNNNLGHIRDDLFEGAHYLRGIDISNNDITELSNVPFKKLKLLLYLNVAGNNISDISKVKELKVLTIYE